MHVVSAENVGGEKQVHVKELKDWARRGANVMMRRKECDGSTMVLNKMVSLTLKYSINQRLPESRQIQ